MLFGPQNQVPIGLYSADTLEARIIQVLTQFRTSYGVPVNATAIPTDKVLQLLCGVSQKPLHMLSTP